MSEKKFAPSPLVAAIRAGRLSGVVSALDDGADIEEADIHGCSGLPLRTACFEGDIAIVRELLRYGATPNAMAADGPGAPVRLALRSGHPEIAALLLQYGAEIPSGIDLPASVTDWKGKLPLPVDDVPIPLLPEAPTVKVPVFSMTEETHADLDFSLEEVDVNGCHGTDTNLLTMELLRSNAEPDNPTASKAPPAGFWQTRHKKN